VEDIKGGGAELLEERNQLLHAILDCTSKNVYTIITNNHDDLKAIERASQTFCALNYIDLEPNYIAN
jgi:gamma-glutamyl phosphate reductase